MDRGIFAALALIFALFLGHMAASFAAATLSNAAAQMERNIH